MARFNVGDTVIVEYNDNIRVNVVKEIGSDNPISYKTTWHYEGGIACKTGWYYLEQYKIIKVISAKGKTKSNMNLREKFALSLKGEPEKTFIKAGVTNMDGSFTAEGRDIFLAYLLSKNGDAFKADVVDALLKEQEEDEAK